MSESVYRKEWIKHHGPIPRDHKGRSYHIHHIDRDRSNNHISNLVVLSVLDHFKEHYDAGEWRAAFAIAINLDDDEISKEELSVLAKKVASPTKPEDHYFNKPEVRAKNRKVIQDKIEKGTFHLQSGEIQRRNNLKLMQQGKHLFQQKSFRKKMVEFNRKQLEDGTHPFLQKETIEKSRASVRKRIEEGTFHLQSPERRKKQSEISKALSKQGNHPFQKVRTCEWCGYVGEGFGFISKHGKYCLDNPDCERTECEYCKKKIHYSVYDRYHGKKCSIYRAREKFNTPND